MTNDIYMIPLFHMTFLIALAEHVFSELISHLNTGTDQVETWLNNQKVLCWALPWGETLTLHLFFIFKEQLHKGNQLNCSKEKFLCTECRWTIKPSVKLRMSGTTLALLWTRFTSAWLCVKSFPRLTSSQPHHMQRAGHIYGELTEIHKLQQLIFQMPREWVRVMFYYCSLLSGLRNSHKHIL